MKMTRFRIVTQQGFILNHVPEDGDFDELRELGKLIATFGRFLASSATFTLYFTKSRATFSYPIILEDSHRFYSICQCQEKEKMSLLHAFVFGFVVRNIIGDKLLRFSQLVELEAEEAMKKNTFADLVMAGVDSGSGATIDLRNEICDALTVLEEHFTTRFLYRRNTDTSSTKVAMDALLPFSVGIAGTEANPSEDHPVLEFFLYGSHRGRCNRSIDLVSNSSISFLSSSCARSDAENRLSLEWEDVIKRVFCGGFVHSGDSKSHEVKSVFDTVCNALRQKGGDAYIALAEYFFEFSTVLVSIPDRAELQSNTNNNTTGETLFPLSLTSISLVISEIDLLWAENRASHSDNEECASANSSILLVMAVPKNMIALNPVGTRPSRRISLPLSFGTASIDVTAAKDVRDLFHSAMGYSFKNCILKACKSLFFIPVARLRDEFMNGSARMDSCGGARDTLVRHIKEALNNNEGILAHHSEVSALPQSSPGHLDVVDVEGARQPHRKDRAITVENTMQHVLSNNNASTVTNMSKFSSANMAQAASDINDTSAQLQAQGIRAAAPVPHPPAGAKPLRSRKEGVRARK